MGQILDKSQGAAADKSALQHSEDQQFKMLVQSVTDYAIYMLDAGGHVASWNMGAQRIKGYTAGQIVGRHFSTFYTPQDRAAGLPAQAIPDGGRPSGQAVRLILPLRLIGQPVARAAGEHRTAVKDRAAGLPAQALATAAREGRYEKEGLRMRKDGTSFMAHVVIDHQDGRDVFPIGNRFIFAAHEIFVLGYVE